MTILKQCFWLSCIIFSSAAGAVEKYECPTPGLHGVKSDMTKFGQCVKSFEDGKYYAYELEDCLSGTAYDHSTKFCDWIPVHHNCEENFNESRCIDDTQNPE